MIRVSNIKIRKDLSEEDEYKYTIEKNRIHEQDILDWQISKKSIDARKKDDVHYNYSIDFKLKDENKYPKFKKVKEFEMPKINSKNLDCKKPIIVGCGPSGLFAALIMVQNCLKPSYS